VVTFPKELDQTELDEILERMELSHQANAETQKIARDLLSFSTDNLDAAPEVKEPLAKNEEANVEREAGAESRKLFRLVAQECLTESGRQTALTQMRYRMEDGDLWGAVVVLDEAHKEGLISLEEFRRTQAGFRALLAHTRGTPLEG
jgi:hypothetical protein